jgi:hypothetical protein
MHWDNREGTSRTEKKVSSSLSVRQRQRRAPAAGTKSGQRRACAAIIDDYLARHGDQLALEPWSKVRELLLEALLARCPGLSTRDYRAALASRVRAKNSGLGPSWEVRSTARA